MVPQGRELSEALAQAAEDNGQKTLQSCLQPFPSYSDSSWGGGGGVEETEMSRHASASAIYLG